MYRGRFAPSPTGNLHLGSAATALVAWLSARTQPADLLPNGGRGQPRVAHQGVLVLRIEDIDTPRIVPGSEMRQLEDLRWLGLTWDEGPDRPGPFEPYRQSARLDRYDAAIEVLSRGGFTYYCDCSRAEIARVASAPHIGEEGPRYPGTCRPFGMQQRAFRRPPALRFAAPDRTVTVIDALQGPVVENVFRSVGDFVLQRGDGVFSYQLAVTVDDLAMGITEVVRGADLLGSAARQALLAELLAPHLGGVPPGFAHVPLVTALDGSRLAKRARFVSVRDYREAGMAAGRVIGALGRALGLVPDLSDREWTALEIAFRFDRSVLVGRRTVAIDLPVAC